MSKEELRKKEEDLEAQASNNTANELAAEEIVSPPPGEYKHMGRGGAGNWFQPDELAAQGVTKMDPPTANVTAEPTEDQKQQSHRAFRGRGGAGNYALQDESVETQAAERQEELEKARELEQAVDKELAKPSQAHVKVG